MVIRGSRAPPCMVVDRRGSTFVLIVACDFEESSMSDDRTYHMTPGQFRQYGRQVVDWIADYYERVETLPVLSRVAPGEIRRLLPDAPPVHGESFGQLLGDMDSVVLPGVTHWQSPK